MSDDTGHLALVIAAVNDESTKARLAKLLEARQAIETAQTELDRATDDNQRIIVGIQEERRALEAARAALATDKAQFDQEKAALTAVVNGHNDERARWEEQRKFVDADHAGKYAKLQDLHASAVAVRDAQTAKGNELDQREAAVAEREAKMERWHSAFDAARQAM